MTILNTISSTQRNGFINSNMDFWQRGTSFSNPSSLAYTADRWSIGGTATGTYTVSRQSFGQQIEVPNNPKYYLRLLASSITSARDLRQNIEGVGSYANQTVTVSFWARVVSGTYVATGGVGFIQFFGTGGSPSSSVNITAQNITLTSSWTKYSFTFAIPSIVGKTLGTNGDDKLAFYINTPNSGSFDAHFSQFMINVGNQTQDWNLAGANLQGELAMCQRYYHRPDWENPSGGAWLSIAQARSTTSALVVMTLPVNMRATPSINRSGLGLNSSTGSTIALTSLTASNASPSLATFSADVASGLVAGNASLLQKNGASDFIEFNAEL